MAVKTYSAKILVLDDEKAFGEMLSEMLRFWGYQPTECISAALALQLIDQSDFDLIISDFHMPGMNGEEFYRRVLQTKPHIAPSLIFLSGDAGNEQTERFFESTGNPHMAKPFRLDGLGMLISQSLMGSRNK